MGRQTSNEFIQVANFLEKVATLLLWFESDRWISSFVTFSARNKTNQIFPSFPVMQTNEIRLEELECA